MFLALLCGSAGKEFACNVEDISLIPGLGRSPGEGKGYPFQDSGLENSIDYIVHGIAKNRKKTVQLSLSLPCMQVKRSFYFSLANKFIAIN